MLKKIFFKLSDEKNVLNKLLPFFILLLFIILNITIIFNLYFKKEEKEDILRLHVVANSNNLNDQITKLKVNEKIKDYFANLQANEKLSKSDIINLAKSNSSDIINIANSVIKENNLNYNASLNIGKIYYDKKESTLLDMEKGNYDSIKVILGNGNGKNIWSLIEPNKENLEKLKGLESILPRINQIYDAKKDEENEENEDVSYSFKIFEILKYLKQN